MLARSPRLSDRDRIEYLEEENRQLRDKIAELTGRDIAREARCKLGLTPSESAIFALLLRCGMATHDQLQALVYEEADVDLARPYEAVRSHMKRMRRRIRPLGIDFKTVYSMGYEMTEDNRVRARKLVSA